MCSTMYLLGILGLASIQVASAGFIKQILERQNPETHELVGEGNLFEYEFLQEAPESEVKEILEFLNKEAERQNPLLDTAEKLMLHGTKIQQACHALRDATHAKSFRGSVEGQIGFGPADFTVVDEAGKLLEEMAVGRTYRCQVLAYIDEKKQGLEKKLGSEEKQVLEGKQGLQGKHGLEEKIGLEGKQGLEGKPGLEEKQELEGKQGLKEKQGLEGKQGLKGRLGYFFEVYFARESMKLKKVEKSVSASGWIETNDNEYNAEMFFLFAEENRMKRNHKTSDGKFTLLESFIVMDGKVEMFHQDPKNILSISDKRIGAVPPVAIEAASSSVDHPVAIESGSSGVAPAVAKEAGSASERL